LRCGILGWMKPVEQMLFKRSRARKRHAREESGIDAQRDRGHGGQHGHADGAPDPFADSERLRFEVLIERKRCSSDAAPSCSTFSPTSSVPESRADQPLDLVPHG
jgi:hypothetical protein